MPAADIPTRSSVTALKDRLRVAYRRAHIDGRRLRADRALFRWRPEFEAASPVPYGWASSAASTPGERLIMAAPTGVVALAGSPVPACYAATWFGQRRAQVADLDLRVANLDPRKPVGQKASGCMGVVNEVAVAVLHDTHVLAGVDHDDQLAEAAGLTAGIRAPSRDASGSLMLIGNECHPASALDLISRIVHATC
jgi:hypothetical protein